MRHLIVTGALIASASLSSVAQAADCDGSLHALDKNATAQENRWVVGPISQDLRELRDAAFIFKKHDLEEACEEVLAGIDALVQQRIEKVDEKAEVKDYDTWSDGEQKRLQAAMGVKELEGSLTAEEVIGSDLRNQKNVDLGEVDDVVLDPDGGIRYAIISHGGFLGIYDKQIAVPWNKLRVTTIGGDRVFVLNTTEKALESAPEFERNAWSEVDSPTWRQDVDKFYSKLGE